MVASLITDGPELIYDTAKGVYRWGTDGYAESFEDAMVGMLHHPVTRAVMGAATLRHIPADERESALQQGWIAIIDAIRKGEAHTRSWWCQRAVYWAREWADRCVTRHYNRANYLNDFASAEEVESHAVAQHYEVWRAPSVMRALTTIDDTHEFVKDDPWAAVDDAILIAQLLERLEALHPRRAALLRDILAHGSKAEAARARGLTRPALAIQMRKLQPLLALVAPDLFSA
jgi:hypothetical protein